MKYKSYLLFPVCLAQGITLCGTAYAEDQQLSEITPAEEVVVWGTEVRASSVGLDQDAIAIKQADHISDLLRTIPGVDVGGAHSLNQRITIRSMDDKDLRISIDGANQNTYLYHHMGNLHVNAGVLESVDVEIGTNSVVNGGLGGTVRFETKSARQLLKDNAKFGGRVQLTSGNNYGSSLALTGYSQLTESVDAVIYHNKLDRDNYEVGGGEILDVAGNVIAGTDGQVRGLEGNLNDTLVKLGWDVADNQRIEVGYESYDDEGDYSYRPDMGLATDLAITNSLGVPLLWPTQLSRGTLTLNYSLQLDQHVVKVAAFNTESELKRDESGWADNFRFAANAGAIQGRADNSGINVLAESQLGDHTLTYGLEVIDYDTAYSAHYLDGSQEAATESAKNTALYLQDRFQFTDRLAVIPGIRYSDYEIDSGVVSDQFSETTLSLAGEFNVNENVTLKLSSTQLFKGPEIGEVFVGAGLFDVENTSIEAETGVNNELSIAYEDALFGADKFGFGLTYFDTEIENYIYDYAPPPAHVSARTWKDNVGDLNIDGVEAYVSYDLGNLSALLTYSDAQSDLDAFAAYQSLNGARLDREQGDTISLNVDYTFEGKNLQMHWDVLSVDDVAAGLDLDGATLDNSKQGFTVHNVSLRWKPEQVNGLELTLGVDNVFDEFYASQSSRTGVSFHPRFGQLYLLDYEPGRNVKATLAYGF